MSRGHMDYRTSPECIKCGYFDMVWTHVEGNVDKHKYEYLGLTCRRCGFYTSMDCKDEVIIKPSNISPKIDERDMEAICRG